MHAPAVFTACMIVAKGVVSTAAFDAIEWFQYRLEVVYQLSKFTKTDTRRSLVHPVEVRALAQRSAGAIGTTQPIVSRVRVHPKTATMPTTSVTRQAIRPASPPSAIIAA